MFESGKAYNIAKETRTLKMDIVGISKTHWPNSEQYTILKYTLYYSGNDAF